MDKNDTKKNEEQKKDKHEENVKKLKEKILELENQVKRTLADYQNLEKRVAEQRRDLIINANKHLLLRLLPVLDTLMLASNHVKDQGLALSVQQFLGVLKDEGVEKIEAAGKLFDPLIMECVETRAGEDWKVLEEIRVGYKFGDMILRPALVAVGKKEILKQVQDDKEKKLWEK